MPYRFRNLELDPLRYQLTRQGEPIDVPRRIFELILLLIRHRDRPVTKEEILATVWHGRTVTDASLTHAIATARRALGDSPKSQDTIKTVHKRGYWWVAETVESELAAPSRFSLSSMPFVGRVREIRAIEGALDQAFVGSASLILLTGEAGIGKTRLLREAISRAKQRRFYVLEASCLEHEGGPPGQPWIEIARQFPGIVPKSKSDTPSTLAIERLAQAFPDLSAATDKKTRLAPSRHSILEQLATLLEAVTATSPTLLAIDDIHRADDFSLSALRFISRQMTSSRLGIVVTARTGIEPRSDSMIGDLARHHGSATVPIGSLHRSDISTLLEGADVSPPADVGDFLFERSGGNPFFVSQLISALIEQGGTTTIPPGDATALPRTLNDAVLKQIDGLNNQTTNLLGGAAALGRSFQLSLLGRIMRMGASEVLDALRPAERRGIVETDPSAAGSQRFRHAILRDAIYSELQPSARAELHLRIGEELSVFPGAEPAAIAHHFRAASPLSEAHQIATAALQAAQKASKASSYLDAVAECRATLRVAGTDLSPEDRCALLVQMASALLRAGHRTEGRTALREAALLARSTGSPIQTADVALAIAPGFFAIETGKVDPELIEALEEALAVAGEEDSLPRVRLLGSLCAALYWSPFSHKNEGLVAEAESIAGRLGHREASAHAIGAWFTGLWSPTNFRARRSRCDELLALAASSGSEDLHLMARVFRITAFLEAADVSRAEAEIAAYAELVRETLHPHAQWYVPMYRSMLAITRGDFADATKNMAEFVSKGSRFDDANVVQTFLLQSAECAWHQGKSREIVAAVEHNVAQNPVLREWQCALALVLSTIGSIAEAKRLCSRLISEWCEPHASRMNAPIAFAALAETCWILDDGDLAFALERIAPAWEERTIVAGYGVLCWGSTSRARGHIAAGQGRLAEAEAYYEEALRSAARMSARPWAARTEIALARTLERTGNSENKHRARRLVRSALREADALGISLPILNDHR
jgi:DNA-binding winged helix-turn-helix (wHTH) protein/tetratricopeptide (TPR) repeat protein